jgi:tetratricopeptide (TPR) repeat protein
VSASVEEILSEATRLEKEYEWLQASELYEKALGMVDEGDYFRRGEIWEKVGHSLHRAAFQAESREEFLERLGKAVKAYEVARGLYDKVSDERGTGRALRCGAVARYLEHWIEVDPSEKLRLLNEGQELERDALTAFQGIENMLEYSRTYNMLPELTLHISCREFEQWGLVTEYDTDEIEKSRARVRQIVEDGIRWGEISVATLSGLGDPYGTARAHYALAHCLVVFTRLLAFGIGEGEQYRSRAREQLHRAIELSERVEDAHTLGRSYYELGFITAGEEGKRYIERALEFCEKTRDIFLMVRVLNEYVDKNWSAQTWINMDLDQKLVQAENIMAFYDRNMRYCSILSFYDYSGGVMEPLGGYCEYYFIRARWETDLQKRLEFLEKSVEDGMEALKLAKAVGHRIGNVRHVLSKALMDRARLEPNVDEKRCMLEKALIYRDRSVTRMEKWGFNNIWSAGIFYSYLSEIKAQLAYIEPDQEDKRRLLEEAVGDKEKALSLMVKWILADERRVNMYRRLSLSQDEYSTQLTNLYELTNESEYLRRAIEASQKTIESASKDNLVSRIAESYWKIAKAQVTLGEHLEAAESFDNASESYGKAAEKIPQLNEFYQEYASYMLAWGEFERAKQSHAEKRYMQAKEHYEKAAELHKSTERWSYLAPNYLAWARLEEAEDLSRREQTEESRDLFQQAVELFSETEDSIKSKLNTIEVGEERQIAEELIKASDIRREYCLGRGALEEARILDRKGDHSASSKMYGQAAEIFQRVMELLEQESDQKEIQPIISLCKAWEKMMKAEDQISPSLYDEAANLFIEARDNASDQTTRLLAQAHSSFCKALEAGTRFELTRETELFSEAKRHIEASTSYYLRAGQQTMSDYAGATSRFLDAYLYTYNAQTEVDLEKKAQFYQIAERLLQSSAGAYLKAKHPEKSDEIRRILGRVKEEREIAVSLSEVLHAPTIVSTTTSFSTPTPTHEQAVGLEKFESADIQANFIARRREVGVGEDLDLEIELVNAGKAPAQLVKVEDIVIEGFELKSYPEICRVEDSYLDLKGRTLSPLKTQELKLVLKPLAKGSFELKPRILYLDESGKYKSHEPDPVSITVQELGIRGWLRGPTR